jgi:hypothetical protein
MAGGVTVTRCGGLSGQMIRIFIRMRTNADKLDRADGSDFQVDRVVQL